MYKFQNLEVYQVALGYIHQVYEVSRQLPDSERFNLKSQLQRAATSVPLNIAEGSTGQTNTEQRRFLGLALRSYLETVACMDLIEHQGQQRKSELKTARGSGHKVFIKLEALRAALGKRLTS